MKISTFPRTNNSALSITYQFATHEVLKIRKEVISFFDVISNQTGTTEHIRIMGEGEVSQDKLYTCMVFPPYLSCHYLNIIVQQKSKGSVAPQLHKAPACLEDANRVEVCQAFQCVWPRRKSNFVMGLSFKRKVLMTYL